MNSTSTLPKWFWFLILGLGMVIFVLGKWSDLFLPFFWDELGVYSRGILYMVDHGPGLLPADLPPELSRGHPLFFYFLFACYTKLFGFSLFNIHVLALLFTLMLSGSIFYMLRQELSNVWALIAALAFLTMPNVYALGCLVLPEMLLALLLIWSIWSFYQKNYGWYILFCSLALLTKETALVTPIACICYLASLFPKPKILLKGIAISLAPLLPYFIFLFVQKVQNGWYFFPYHTQFISFEWAHIQTNLSMSLELLGHYQGRWALSIVTLLGGIWALSGIKRQRIQTFFHQISPLVWLSFIFFLGILGFTALNVYMDRYLLVLQPVLLIWLAFGLAWLQKKGSLFRLAATILGLLVLFIPLLYLEGKEFRYDQDINYRQIVRVQEQATEYLESNLSKGSLFFANFPLYYCFEDERLGFLKSPPEIQATVKKSDPISHIAIFEPPFGEWMYQIQPDSIAQKISHFQEGYARALIYELPATTDSISPSP